MYLLHTPLFDLFLLRQTASVFRRQEKLKRGLYSLLTAVAGLFVLQSGAPARLVDVILGGKLDALRHDLPELPELDNLFAPEVSQFVR